MYGQPLAAALVSIAVSTTASPARAESVAFVTTSSEVTAPPRAGIDLALTTALTKQLSADQVARVPRPRRWPAGLWVARLVKLTQKREANIGVASHVWRHKRAAILTVMAVDRDGEIVYEGTRNLYRRRWQHAIP